MLSAGISTAPTHVVSLPVSEDVGGLLSLGYPPLANPALPYSVAPCSLPLSDRVFSPSIVSTNISTSSEGRSIRYALRSREISFEGSGGKVFLVCPCVWWGRVVAENLFCSKHKIGQRWI